MRLFFKKLLNLKYGVITLIATLLHEIPHEIGDFVILIKSGLNYRQAAIAQVISDEQNFQ
jgi:zinc transporter 13